MYRKSIVEIGTFYLLIFSQLFGYKYSSNDNLNAICSFK